MSLCIIPLSCLVLSQDLQWHFLTLRTKKHPSVGVIRYTLILSSLVVSHHALHFLILSYLILTYPILSCLISSHLILSYLSYLILSYLILSYLILSYLIVSYRIRSYIVLSYLRTCNGMTLPCSPRNISQCVSADQASKLFQAGDWTFRHRYTFQVKTAPVFSRVSVNTLTRANRFKSISGPNVRTSTLFMSVSV